ncbi:MAG: DUF4337 domain-containing protein [Alphaproteobacteria bacterium]|nr:DUF4337 domain-containing protein [Alphaproteobacteria bacterium]
MVEQTEIPEQAHHHHHHLGHEPHVSEGFRRFSAVYVGVVAMLLAISSLGGGKATKEMLAASIRVSDTYAFAQAKYFRQTAYELAADQMEADIAALPTIPDAAKAKMNGNIERYRKSAARYASDPATGEGRQELLAKAKEWEEVRDRAEAQDPNFQFANALFQIAIVLASVAIAGTSRPLLGLSIGSAAIATLLAINGFFLLVPLPVG